MTDNDKPKVKKHCSNPACALRDTQIETNASECVACGRPLKEAVGDLMKRIFGEQNDNPFAGLFDKHHPK